MYAYGHSIYWDGGSRQWRYTDDNSPVPRISQRPCPQCHQLPTPEGHDACLGTIPGATAACCGHGVEMGYIAWEEMPGVVRRCYSLTLFGRVFEIAMLTAAKAGEAVSDPRFQAFLISARNACLHG